MTLRQITEDVEYDVSEHTKHTIDLLEPSKPYIKTETLSGYTYTFAESFTDVVVDAFLNNDIDELNRVEKDFIKLFIEWQNFLLTDPENPIEAGSEEDTFESLEKDALIALNDWLVDKLAEEA